MSQYTSADPLELLQRVRAGSGPDRGRLLELYRQYLTLPARLQIGRRLQGKVDGADLAEDTFLQAHLYSAIIFPQSATVIFPQRKDEHAGQLAWLQHQQLSGERSC